MKIRHGGLDDVPAVLDFWLLAAEGTDRRDSPDKVVALIERDPEALQIAELDGELVGTLIAGWDGWRAHLYRLAVHPAHRRKGIATTLLAAAESRFPPSAPSAPMPWCWRQPLRPWGVSNTQLRTSR